MALGRCGIFFLRPVDLKEGVRVGSTQFACFLVCRVCIHIQRGFPPKRNSLGRSCVVCPAFAIRNRPVRFASDSTGCIFDIKDVLTNWDLIEDGAKMGLSWLLNDCICNAL